MKILLPLLLLPALSVAQQEFKTCHEPGYYACDDYPEYYVVEGSYKGGFRAVKQLVFAQYKPAPEWNHVSGYFTVKFIVNCKNETGRHQFFSLDKNLQPQTIPEAMKTRILMMVKGLKDWLPGTFNGAPTDYYYHITLKIRNGQLEEVLP